jgi:hypothetical protein
MTIIKGKKGDSVTGLGFERGRDTQEELWQIAKTTERRKAVLLPALLNVALKALIEKAGAEAREDVTTLLSRAAALPLIGIPPDQAGEMTLAAMGVAHSMLDAANPEDAAEAVLAAAFLITKLADEGKYPGGDIENQAVLVSLMVIQEAREAPEVGWALREDRMSSMVSKMLHRADLSGIPLL